MKILIKRLSSFGNKQSLTPLKSFILNGRTIEVQHVLDGAFRHSKLTSFEIGTLNVIRKWLTGKKQFTVKTSGSTGKPRDITFVREQIKKSAQRTLDEFALKKGDTILACLHSQNIAGFMMLVRAMEGNLNLIIKTPRANPFENIEEIGTIDFVALTPHQVDTALKKNPERFNKIDKVLIGGAGLSYGLERELQELKTSVFHSYALTETLSHVALRRVNGNERSSCFHAIKGVSFSVDDRSCMVINDELLGISHLVTNDIIDLKAHNSFEWKGRIDNVTNSGGIKIQLEELEEKVRAIFSKSGIKNSYCIVSLPDETLGERLILLIEKEIISFSIEDITDLLKSALPKYHSPKQVINVANLFMTKSGKIDRKRNREVYIRGVKN